PDPIGFKGDASNLYRYCGNDWANRTDPMGLQAADFNSVAENPLRNLPPDDVAHDQAILNLKIGLGYGATQIAGLVNKIEKLSQTVGHWVNHKLGRDAKSTKGRLAF